jgi:Tol biopolymer transport system component
MSSRAARAVFLSLVFLAANIVGVALAAPHADAAYPGQDGRIAFVRANQIYTMTSSGTGVRQLTTTGKNYRPKWSPAGTRISYIHEAQGRRDVWVMSASGRNKTAVTRSGDVTSAGASWSPNGRRLAFATSQLQRIRSTAPFGSPTALSGLPTGGFCDGDGTLGPVYVDRFVAWSPDGTRIAVFDHSDCYFDDRIDMYYPATDELRQYAASGADCCGYTDWTDLFWGSDGRFGYSERDLGPYGEDVDAPSRIVFPGFRSLDGDTGGAPSPSGTYMALTTASSGTAKIIRATASGSGRRVLTTGYQPDWQPLP